MEISPIQPYSLNVLYNSNPLPFLFPYYQFPQNYVHWTQTPESHIYSADLPGGRVGGDQSGSGGLKVPNNQDRIGGDGMRKFRLPSRVDLEGISAGYENGVLTVTVPRSHVRRGFYIDPSDLPDNTTLEVTARAA